MCPQSWPGSSLKDSLKPGISESLGTSAVVCLGPQAPPPAALQVAVPASELEGSAAQLQSTVMEDKRLNFCVTMH